MKGVTTHGIFLAVMLIVAYQAWTPDEPRATNPDRDGTIRVWDLTTDEMRKVTYRSPRRTTILDRRGEQGSTYLWGMSSIPLSASAQDSTTEAVPDTPAVDPEPAQMEEYPVGEDGDELWERLAGLRALRDLGVVDSAAKEQYELDEPERRLVIETTDGERVLEIGGTVYAGSQRYAFDPVSGRGYVLADQITRPLENGSSSLRMRRLHRFDRGEITAVTVRGPSGERTMTREPAGVEGDDGWVSPDAPDSPDQTFQNFMNHVQTLGFRNYESTVSVDTMELLVRIDYHGDGDSTLGFLELYRVTGGQPDLWEYYLQTEATRIPAHAHRTLAERVDRDLTDIF